MNRRSSLASRLTERTGLFLPPQRSPNCLLTGKKSLFKFLTVSDLKFGDYGDPGASALCRVQFGINVQRLLMVASVHTTQPVKPLTSETIESLPHLLLILLALLAQLY